MRTDGEITQDEIVDLLDRLVAKSLIGFDATTSRYRCLETVRQYAREQHLTALDAGAEDRRDKHATFFHDLLGSLEDSSDSETLSRIDADYENMRQAIDWWSMQPAGGEVLDMVWEMYRYWYARGLLKEGSQRAASVLEERKSHKNAAYANALFTYADLTMHLGNFEEAKTAFDEMLSIGRNMGDLEVQLRALSGLAGLHQDHVVDYHLSRAYRLQCLELAEQVSDGERYKGRSYYNLGDLTLHHHPDLYTDRRREALLEARSYFEKAREFSRGQFESRATYFLLAGFAGVDLQLGDFASAKTRAIEGFRFSLKSGYTLGLSVNLYVLAGCALTSGFPDVATILIHASIQIIERTGFVPGVKEQAEGRQILDTCLQQLGEQTFHELADRARSMTHAELLDLAEREIKV